MGYFIYILRSEKDGRLYIGSSSDPEARLRFHNSGLQRSTRRRIPFILLKVEEYATKGEALAREKVLKSYKGGMAMKRLLGSTEEA